LAAFGTTRATDARQTHSGDVQNIAHTKDRTSERKTNTRNALADLFSCVGLLKQHLLSVGKWRRPGWFYRIHRFLKNQILGALLTKVKDFVKMS